MDFSSQKFCNETSLGQNSPWDKAVLGTKQSLDRTSSANLRQNLPIFRDGLSVPENKTSLTHRKLLRLRLPCCCLGGPDPVVWPLRRGPGGPAPSGTAKNDAALAPTVSSSGIRLHKKFGTSLVHFVEQNLGMD
jgi:hypothetical protein